MEMNQSSETMGTSAPKKPYEKPAFRHEQVFVTTALSCGKISSTQSSCIGHQSAS
jgi:hypothetical protein